MNFLKKYATVFLSLISVLLYFYVAYFLKRTEFNLLVSVWSLLFLSSYFLWKNNQNNFNLLVGLSFLFRLIFLFSIPNLSQDFYRFIWDGRMIFEGFNPYVSLPVTFIEQGNLPVQQATELYNGMGVMNGSHYTNYPPINQLCFMLAALFAKNNILGSVVVMRVLIILADIGILYFGKKLLLFLKIPIYHIFLYLLNPFIILELTGNLHFEPVMLFFLIWSIYLLSQRKWFLAAVVLACSVSVKLIPLLFLPLFYQWFTKNEATYLIGIKRLSIFYIVVILTVVLLFLPFYSPTLLTNYANSVGLWFQNFEFNASVYYVAREIGYLFRGYNEIAILGKVMPVLTILFILGITFFKKNKTIKQLITAMLFCLSFYYFTTTTMHPWYLATLVLLAVFTPYKFTLVWSFVIILSYQAYANLPWKENLWILFTEYLTVYGFFMWEMCIKKPTQD